MLQHGGGALLQCSHFFLTIFQVRGDVEEKLGVSLQKYSVISFALHQEGEYEKDYKIQVGEVRYLAKPPNA